MCVCVLVYSVYIHSHIHTNTHTHTHTNTHTRLEQVGVLTLLALLRTNGAQMLAQSVRFAAGAAARLLSLLALRAQKYKY